MNQREWKLDKNKIWKYYNKCRKIQKSLKYNNDPNAIVIHHLRDTKEQQEYNDKYYEFWGFEIDENGNESFEYGKYVIFVTKEEHCKIHSESEETRKKLSIHAKQYMNRPDTKLKYSLLFLGNKNPNKDGHNKRGWKTPASVKLKQKIANIAAYTEERREFQRQINLGDKNPYFGKHHTDEEKLKISESSKLRWQNKEYRDLMISKSKNRMAAYSYMYKMYKANNGKLKFNKFRTAFKNGDITFELQKFTVYKF